VNTGKKCLAKANYFIPTNCVSIIGSHNDHCSKCSLDVNNDFLSQKQEIQKMLTNNLNLTVTGAIDSLRKKKYSFSRRREKMAFTI